MAGAGWRRISCSVPAARTTITMRKGIGGKTELKIKLRGKKDQRTRSHTDNRTGAPVKGKPHRKSFGSALHAAMATEAAQDRTGQPERTERGTRCGAVRWAGWFAGSVAVGEGSLSSGGGEKDTRRSMSWWQRAMTRPAPAVVSAKERKMTKSKGSAPHCAV